MNKYIYIIGVALFLTATTASAQVSNDNEDEVNKVSQYAVGDYVPGEVLVKFKDDNRIHVQRARGHVSTNCDRITAVLQKYGVDEMEQLLPNQNPKRQLARTRAYNGDYIQEHDLSQLYHVKLSAAHQQETKQAVDELKGLDEVEFAEPNYKVYMMSDTHIADSYSDNPMLNQQWGLDNFGVKELWNKPIINKERPIIAILDTGVDLTHPDLKDNIWTNIAEAYGTKDNDNDGNGFNNDVHGWDFVNNSPNVRDNNMHGTHVAGIAAAANNGIGIIGANPQALIMPITVLQSDGSGDMATIIKGINYATENGAAVLNMSWGLYVNSRVLRQALETAYSKAILVAAAGNEGRCIYASHWKIKHFPPEPESMPCFPAAYSFVLGVQASDHEDYVTEWSNYDDDGPIYSCETTFFESDGFNYELKAPGRKILSTIPGGSYKILNGTSMAAPLVAGSISALMMVKQYDTQEILWGDLLHTNNIAEAYQLKDRPAELDLLNVMLRDRKELSETSEKDYSDDKDVDAGEAIQIYPVLKTTFGEASNIRLKLEVGEFEDPSVVEFLTAEANFGYHLDAFGKGVSQNPLVIKIPNTIAEARHISLKVVATCDENSKSTVFPLVLVAHNMIKISGMINEDRTLTANHVYYVNGTLAVNKGVTLTIEPGTRLEFATGVNLSAFGKLIAKGTPEKPITFCRHIGEGAWGGIYSHQNEGGHSHNSEHIYTNADSTLFTLLPTELTPNDIQPFSRRLYYGENETPPTCFFQLEDYVDDYDLFEGNMTGREHLLTDPDFLTSAVLQMKKDFEDYCGLYSLKPLEEKKLSKLINSMFFRWETFDNPRDTLTFCRIDGCTFQNSNLLTPYMRDCVLENVARPAIEGVRCVITGAGGVPNNLRHTNIVNNVGRGSYSQLYACNFLNNFLSSNGKVYSLGIDANTPTIEHAEHPSYLGTGREDIIRPYIWEMGNAPDTWGVLDLSNMPKQPIAEAHGIVWKVLVDEKDAQDEFEEIPPLGVGRHKFEVYFNRPMNKTVVPQVAFGVRDPYTQNGVGEEGSWNADGTVYTVFATLSGKTSSDGLNRISVWGAEDNEYVMCPQEKTRFNVMVQVAGSMSTGFAAQAGRGCVRLSWNNENNHFEDAMGFNVYRFIEYQKTLPAEWRDGKWHDVETVTVRDTVRVNEDILDIESVSLTDYNVQPGETYYYYYKVLSTDLQEYDVSNVVAATPLTSTRGDANGSGTVDVSDVITTVNYITNKHPQPFIFEAADMNEDQVIDILDLMGIVNGVLNPSLLASSQSENTAIYLLEDGIVYVETPVTLGGVQIQLSGPSHLNDNGEMINEYNVAKDLDGFETASTWLSESDYLFLSYSMSGRTLGPGKHALLHIGDADIASIRLCDTFGRNVKVVACDNNNTTSIDCMGKHVMSVDGIYDLQGRKLSTNDSRISTLKKGVYIINGKKVVK